VSTFRGEFQKVGTFTPDRPAFQRVIAVSYSALDRFNKPKTKRTFSYRYCGIYDKEGRLHSRQRLLATLRDSAAQIAVLDRRERWESTIEAVLNRDVMKSIRDYLFPADGEDSEHKPPKLSSGQLVLVSTITELLAALDRESMILFDEPELHQHPNAVAGLMESLHTLLDEFDSYAILATHSPLVVQQIPSAYVRVFIRTGNATVIRDPVNECFGENLTTITQEVFQTSTSPSLYAEWLKAAIVSLEEDEILRLFPKGLSFNALSVMQSLK
jgi:hypothetical protein